VDLRFLDRDPRQKHLVLACRAIAYAFAITQVIRWATETTPTPAAPVVRARWSVLAVTSVLDTVARGPQVARAVSIYTTPAPSLVSRDRHTTYAAITLRARDDDQKLADYRVIKPTCAPAATSVPSTVGSGRSATTPTQSVPRTSRA
jgi:hypothetical protein